jgi:hypothetical protein
LYQKSLKDVGKAKRLYEAYFNDKFIEATTSGKIPKEVDIPNLTVIGHGEHDHQI